MKSGALRLYIGIPDDNDMLEYLYLDLVIPNREIPLWKSKTDLNNISGEDFLGILEKALNEASLWTIHLGTQLQIDAESIVEMADDFTDRSGRDVRKLLKEVKHGN